MNSETEKLIKNLSDRVNELEKKVLLLEDPMRDVQETNLLKTRVGANY